METNLNINRPLPQRKITNKVLGNLIPFDFLPLYTFLAIFFKNLLLISFILDQTHQSPLLGKAYSTVFTLYRFRPVYYIAFSLALTFVIFLFKNRVRFLAAIILNFLVSFLLLTDLWYMRGFNTLPTLHTLQAGGNMGDSLSSFFPLISIVDLLFVVDIPVLILVFVFKKNWYRNVGRNIIFSAIVVIFSVFAVFYIAPQINRQSPKPLPITSIFNKFDAVTTIRSLSPLGYNIYSSYQYLTEKNTINLSKAEKDKIAKWYEKKKENLPDNEYKALFAGKNLLFIQFESLEKFVVNQKVNGQEITPTINRLLKNSLYFSGIHEQVGGGNSSDSDLMINASVYPLQLGATFLSNPFTHYNSLPLLLEDNGYYTSTIQPSNGAFWNWMPALTSMGFDKCYDSSNYKITEKINMGISDEAFFEQIEPIIAKQKQPFYTFMVTLSSHSPFGIGDSKKELKLDEELGKSRMGAYMQAVHYTDRQIGVLLDKLQKDGVLDNTVVAIIGDHEGIHKYFPQEIATMKNAEDWWKDNKKQLPLIIYNKDISPAEIGIAGGQIDIMPTLAYLMGVKEESYINSAMGRNLLKTTKNYAILRDRTFVGNPDENDRAIAAEGFELADNIIRGNYFKKAE